MTIKRRALLLDSTAPGVTPAVTVALSRRNLMLAGGAALFSAALPRPAFATRKISPGGFSPERLAKLTAALQRYVDEDAVVGHLTLLYRHGEVAQVNALGFQDREANLPMKRDTIFRLASMTKPVTCVAALTLVEQGKIGLYEPIDKWIPELANPKVLNNPDGSLTETHPAPRPITLADLLTHRAGIAGMSATGALAKAMAGIRDGDPTFDEWFKRLGAIPLAYDPGSHFNYGTSHDVLGGLIQRISGQSFGQYLKTTIFDPLGMMDTGFWLPKEKQGRLAALYSRDSATGKHAPNNSRPIPTASTNFASGAGGLVSTADDYLKFASMMLGKGRLGDARILTRPTIAMMTTNWLTPEQRKAGFVGNSEFWASQGFGLGVSITDDLSRLGRNPYTSRDSFGWPGSTGVWWRADPQENMVAIYMVQNASQLPNVVQQPGNMSNAASASRPANAGAATGASAAMRTPPSVAFVNLAYEAIDA